LNELMLGSHVQLMRIEYASKTLVGFTRQQIIMCIENVSAYAFYLVRTGCGIHM